MHVVTKIERICLWLKQQGKQKFSEDLQKIWKADG
jgi:hypothetical protein